MLTPKLDFTDFSLGAQASRDAASNLNIDDGYSPRTAFTKDPLSVRLLCQTRHMAKDEAATPAHVADPQAPQVVDPREQMVLDEAQRGIDQQKKDLEGLRSRAGATIGYATVVISVIGGIVLRDSAKMSHPTWAGIVLFALTAALSVFVLAPRTLTFGLDPKAMDQRIDAGASISDLMRATSDGLVDSHAANQSVLEWMHRAYLASVIALLVEAAVLIFDLARR